MVPGFHHKLVGMIRLDHAGQFRYLKNFAFVALKSIKLCLALPLELAAGVLISRLPRQPSFTRLRHRSNCPHRHPGLSPLSSTHIAEGSG
ncbi:hypothetical protein WG66_016682 [Moniliophthora roreri]|nr:hypothetical protein WG66_016682 [Moniliophthora roreri]